MVKIKGRDYGLAASWISLAFSILGLIFFGLIRMMLNLPEFYDTVKEAVLSEGGTIAEANIILDGTEVFFNVCIGITLLYAVLGIVTLVMSYKLNAQNKGGIGVLYIVASILHLISFRLVAFVLFLVAGIQVSSKQKQLEEESITDV